MSKRLTAVLTLLVLLGVFAVIGAKRAGGQNDGRAPRPAPMTAEDGTTYLVEPEETLGSAMEKGAVHSVAPQEEAGACVPEPMEDKPAGAIGCHCYEITECKGNEARECKRHCRKDLCQCCDL
jgi:hypothetical protein